MGATGVDICPAPVTKTESPPELVKPEHMGQSSFETLSNGPFPQGAVEWMSREVINKLADLSDYAITKSQLKGLIVDVCPALNGASKRGHLWDISAATKLLEVDRQVRGVDETQLERLLPQEEIDSWQIKIASLIGIPWSPKTRCGVTSWGGRGVKLAGNPFPSFALTAAGRRMREVGIQPPSSGSSCPGPWSRKTTPLACTAKSEPITL